MSDACWSEKAASASVCGDAARLELASKCEITEKVLPLSPKSESSVESGASTPTAAHGAQSPPLRGIGHAPTVPLSFDLGSDQVLATSLSSATTLQGALSDGAPADDRARLSVRQSLGRTGIAIIFGGSLGVLVVMAFLVFLWAGGGPSGGNHASGLWRTIMLRGWATQAMTLSTLVLRTITSAQAAVCTSLVAALVLERHQVRLSQLAQFSVNRSVNDGPRGLVLEILASRSARLIFCPETVLLATLYVATLGIEFSSTILVPDFATASLAQNSERQLRNVALSAHVNPDDLAYALEMNSVMPVEALRSTFGEVDLPHHPEPNEYGVSYTGLTTRAFPPFDHDERTRLRSYSGVAFAMNTQVSCLRPSIDAEVEMRNIEFDGMVYYLAGTISYNETFKNSGIDRSLDCLTQGDASVCYPETFNCTIPSKDLHKEGYWPTALCLLQPPAATVEEATKLDPEQDSLWNPTSMHFLTFASNANLSYFEEKNIEDTSLSSPVPVGEWNSYELFPGGFLNVTLCSAALNTSMIHVDMSTENDPQEPSFTWNPNGTSSSTEQLEIMMGADPAPRYIGDRGILTVNEVVSPAPASGFDVSADEAAQAIEMSKDAAWKSDASIFWGGASNNWSVAVCTHCSLDGWTTLPDGAAVFESIINEDGRAAMAMNSLLTLLMQSFFSYLVPLLDVPGYVDVVFSKEASIPKNWDGLIAVLVMLMVELLTVLAITGLYLRNVRYSRQGNYWHAVAQILSDQTRPILAESHELRDHDVERRLGGNNPMVSLGASMSGSKSDIIIKPQVERSIGPSRIFQRDRRD
ncbi:hypothetical protein F5Y15DRAFT_427694 [Xylariaceae sp. FL0016]|nr:hypothetical protein F5Y15DRAFT_427694 [Xylariaceae sp. FL0016]